MELICAPYYIWFKNTLDFEYQEDIKYWPWTVFKKQLFPFNANHLQKGASFFFICMFKDD